MKIKLGKALAEETRAAGITVVADDGQTLRFECRACGQGWSVNWIDGAAAAADWWKCPDGCNKNIARPSEVEWKRFMKEVKGDGGLDG